MRGDLPTLVRAAREAGALRVVLETNATLVDGGMAAALADAGLAAAVVNLAGDGAWLDAVTDDPGGFEATLRGIDALLAAGIAVDVQAAAVRATARRLPELPSMLRARFGARIDALWLAIPFRASDASQLLTLNEAAEVIRRVEGRARREGLACKLVPEASLPPCVHGGEARLSHLHSMSGTARGRDDHAHLPACAECVVQRSCDGFPAASLARGAIPELAPIRSERVRRRLTLIGTVEEQVQRELVSYSRHRDPVRGVVEEALVRVVFQCNQACRFCFVSTHLPTASDEVVEAAIVRAASLGQKVTLTGGEPTLHPRLPAFVRLARAHSSLPVLLQTNATRLGEGPLLAQLVEAGLGEAFVSLHGACAETSDAVTEAPGTFVRTVAGIDALAAAGVGVQLNFVICQRNLGELTRWVELVAARWPGAFANVSFVAPSTDVVPREAALVPRYVEVLPELERAFRRASELGVALGGFESMCGVPLCLTPSDLRAFFALPDVRDGEDEGEFEKGPTCASCALTTKCYGLRRGYVELHGDGELRPVNDAAIPA